jgi:NADH-quinone oxidoreductase subunit M
MFVMGFFPAPFLAQTEPTTTFLLETIEEKRAAVESMEAPPTAEEASRSRLQPAPPNAAEVKIDADRLRTYEPKP